MKIEDIEISWQKNQLSYDNYMPQLIEVAKAAKAWQQSAAFSGICDEEVSIELALKELEKD